MNETAHKPTTSSATPEPLSQAAVVALFAGAFMLVPVAVVAAIVALIDIRRSPTKKRGTGLAILVLVQNLVVLPIVLALVVNGYSRISNPCYEGRDAIRGELRMVRDLEERFHAKNARFGTLDEIGYKPAGDGFPFELTVEETTADTYTIRAVGQRAMEGDRMTLRTGEISIDVDACKVATE